MNVFYATFSTPLGEFSSAIDATGALVGTAFGDVHVLSRRLGKCHLLYDNSKLSAVRKQLDGYFAGGSRQFTLALAPRGTEFQQRVWRALREIPFGETRSYGKLARELGAPNSARAVGRANATNPICLVVPCHRVIGADGSLTGFAFGEDIKRRLLAHEREVALASRAA